MAWYIIRSRQYKLQINKILDYHFYVQIQIFAIIFRKTVRKNFLLSFVLLCFHTFFVITIFVSVFLTVLNFILCVFIIVTAFNDLIFDATYCYNFM